VGPEFAPVGLFAVRQGRLKLPCRYLHAIFEIWFFRIKGVGQVINTFFFSIIIVGLHVVPFLGIQSFDLLAYFPQNLFPFLVISSRQMWRYSMVVLIIFYNQLGKTSKKDITLKNDGWSMGIIVVPPVRTVGQFVAVLLTLWTCFLFFNLFLHKTGIFTQTNLIFISLIVITSIAYILGRIYFKNRK
jgi:hypothetical protein